MLYQHANVFFFVTRYSLLVIRLFNGWKLKGEAQAEIAARVRRREVAAARHAPVPAVVVPAAPSLHAVGARRGAGGIGLRAAAVAAPPVPAPLLHVAAHVVQTQRVACLGGNAMVGGAAAARIPCHILDSVAASVLVALAAVAATCGILPLGLGGQAEVLPCHLIQLGNKRLAIVPAHPLHRALQVAGEAAGVAAHHGLPQLLGDLGLPDAVAA